MFYFQLSIILICLFLRSTEHDHVKDNLPAKLLRIRTFGKMKLEDFKDLISVPDYKTCETKMEKNPTWYPLTLDVFVKFLYKVILLFNILVFFNFLYCFLFVLERGIQRSGYCVKVVP